MRFGKRLALAMIRDAGEAPYLSQKPLKHILVGLEKLCKAFSEQSTKLLSDPLREVINSANLEREKYGLSQSSGILCESEIIARDHQFFLVLDADVAQIRRYVEKCEAALMEAINAWLEDAFEAGLIVADTTGKMANLITSDSSHYLKSRLEQISQEQERLVQYISVNTAAIKKLVSRRNKNVPPCFWSVKEYVNLEEIKSGDEARITEAVDFIKGSFDSL